MLDRRHRHDLCNVDAGAAALDLPKCGQYPLNQHHPTRLVDSADADTHHVSETVMIELMLDPAPLRLGTGRTGTSNKLSQIDNVESSVVGETNSGG